MLSMWVQSNTKLAGKNGVVFSRYLLLISHNATKKLTKFYNLLILNNLIL